MTVANQMGVNELEGVEWRSVSNERVVFMLNGPTARGKLTELISSKFQIVKGEPWNLFRMREFDFDQDSEMQSILDKNPDAPKPLALNVSFIGEKGFELHVPVCVAAKLYKKLTE